MRSFSIWQRRLAVLRCWCVRGLGLLEIGSSEMVLGRCRGDVVIARVEGIGMMEASEGGKCA